MTIIKSIKFGPERSRITRSIISALPEWFEDEQSNEMYIREVAERDTWAAYCGDTAVGVISLQSPSENASEIHFMAILPDYHRAGIGRQLVRIAGEYARLRGHQWLLVKTLDSGLPSPFYDKTRHFYLATGFIPLEVIPDFWGEGVPCLNMIKTV